MKPQREEIPLGINKSELLKMHQVSPTRKALYSPKITMTILQCLGGYQILFKSEKGVLSAIFHSGSYGCEEGLWEIMPSKPPKS